MFSRKHDVSAYPAVPDSLHSHSADFNRTLVPRADTAPYITPYLSLRARLSQLWINRWTVLLLLVLARVLLRLSSLNNDLANAKVTALSACTKVEDIGSALASMPHYLSVGVNDLAATGIDKAVGGMVDGLELVLDGVAALILFVINMMTSTYTCLITAMIHGGLDVAGEVTPDVTNAMLSAIKDITNGLQSDASSIQSSINSFASDIENSVFGKVLPNIPQVNISGPINDLNNIQIDTSGFVKDLDSLNSSLPTFQQVQNLTSEAINTPFNYVKQALNQSYGAFTFDSSVFPVADKQALTFCSNNSVINDFFDDLSEIAATAKIVFIVVILILAILACVPMGYLEIRRWNKQKKHAALVETNNGFDPMDVIYVVSRPFTANLGTKVAKPFEKGSKRHILARWCFAYATSLPALFVLSLAIAGFFSCLCQIILYKAIQKEVPILAAQVENFANEVVSTLEDVSEQWANGANGVITSFNDRLNNDVLGYVVNATTAVNDTLNTFISTMNTGLDTIFNGTILDGPIHDVVNCLIGLKVASVEQGLTWVHDNAHITFPLFPNDTFSIGAAESISGDSDLTSFLASPASVSTDDVTSAVAQVTNAMYNSIVQEALVSTGLLLVYIIVVLIGVIRTLSGMTVPGKGRAEGGFAQYTGDDRPLYSPPPHQQTRDLQGPFSDEYAYEEKYPSVSGGRATEVKGHVRTSSYGQFESDNKI